MIRASIAAFLFATTIFAIDPKLARAHTNLGHSLQASGDPRGAVAAYEEAIKLDPKDANAHIGLAVATGAGMRDDSAQRWTAAIQAASPCCSNSARPTPRGAGPAVPIICDRSASYCVSYMSRSGLAGATAIVVFFPVARYTAQGSVRCCADGR